MAKQRAQTLKVRSVPREYKSISSLGKINREREREWNPRMRKREAGPFGERLLWKTDETEIQEENRTIAESWKT